LIVWPLWTVPLMSRKIMSMLLILFFTYLAFCFFPVSVCFDSPRTADAFLSECFSNHCHFFRVLHKIRCCSFVGSIAKSHHGSKWRDVKKICSYAQLPKILHTDSQDMLVLSSTVASR
jgi:hypothetical protein